MWFFFGGGGEGQWCLTLFSTILQLIVLISFIRYKVLFFLNYHLPAFDEQTFKTSNKSNPNILMS